VEAQSLRDSGAVAHYDTEFPPAMIHITVNTNEHEVIRYVIHELLHVTLSEIVIGRFALDLEEIVILAIEEYMTQYVLKSRARLLRWRNLIDQKLTASYNERPDLSVEEIITPYERDSS
jgi:hypothetical protein